MLLLAETRVVRPCQKDRRRNKRSWHSLSFLIVKDWSNSLQSKKDSLQRIVLCKSGIVTFVDEYFTVAGRYLSITKLVGTNVRAQAAAVLLPSMHISGASTYRSSL
jgi:hypothetical protein